MMPLPWKKHKVSRISRIVADLQSPKRGGSLVVETGFPTSLIDLFVKNRYRLKKKPSTKTKPTNPITHTNLSSDSFSTLSESPPPPPPPCVADVHQNHLTPTTPSDQLGDSFTDDDRNRNQLQLHAVFVAVFKFFLVVVLLMTTKTLALGITMSAFLLILLDYLWKRSLPFFEPSKVVFESLRFRVSEFLPFKLSVVEEQDSVVAQLVVSETEIQIVETSFDNININTNTIMGIEEEIVSMGPDLEFHKDEKPKVVEEEEDGGVVLVCKNQYRSRSGRFKSKILKKLVPKKFRKNKGKQGESSSEVSSNMGDDRLSSVPEQEDQQEDCKEQEQESENRSASLPLLEEEDQVVLGGISSSNEETGDIGKGKGKGKRREREGSFGYLILFLMVLAGLAGGRVVAVVVTISWCFMLKLIGPRWRSVNVPIFRCPVPISS